MTRAGLALAVALSACGGRQWLERDVPAACRTDYALCEAWSDVEARWRGTLGVYDEHGLTGYVQRVSDGLARAGHLGSAPRVLLTDGHYGAAMVRARDLIIVRRDVLAVLDSEAELAAMMAHELIHVAARHLEDRVTTDQYQEADWLAGRIDDEAVADERAVELLAAAGYPAHAMLDMMRALDRLDRREAGDQLEEDTAHPPLPERLARIAAMVRAHGPGGDPRRARYLRHLVGLVYGEDVREGVMIGRAWIAIEAGVALTVARRWHVLDDRGLLSAEERRYHAELDAIVVSGPWGRMLASRLRDRRRVAAGPRTAIRGVMPADFDRPAELLSPIDRVLEAGLARAWRPAIGAEVAFLDRGATGLIVAVQGEDSARFLDDLLATVRAPTPSERGAIIPARVIVRPAAVSGALDAVVLATCGAFERSREPHDPAAQFVRGDLVRCLVPEAPGEGYSF